MDSCGDPVPDPLLRGEASTVDEAEELYLDRHLDEVVALVDCQLSDEEFRRHPLIVLLLARGGRPFEDSLVTSGPLGLAHTVDRPGDRVSGAST